MPDIVPLDEWFQIDSGEEIETLKSRVRILEEEINALKQQVSWLKYKMPVGVSARYLEFMVPAPASGHDFIEHDE